jgi:cold shock CspA family protein
MNELKNISIEELREGDKVSFEVGEGPKGPNAINVSKI